jgi:hypothetical protein
MRVESLCIIVQKFTHYFSVNQFYFRIIPVKLSRIAKQHSSNSAHLMMRFLQGLSMHVYQFFVHTCFYALLQTRATRGAGVVGTSTYPSITNTTVNVLRP